MRGLFGSHPAPHAAEAVRVWNEVGEMMYKVCPDCGAHLDSGERCDCEKELDDNDESDALEKA